jgi:hypothetical protein
VLRWGLLASLNLLFFGCVFGAAAIGSFIFSPVPYSGQQMFTVPSFLPRNWFLIFSFVLVFNLIVSVFTVVTLPGFFFFPLSASALAFRAILWGLLVFPVPTPLFLAGLPTLVLEGEAYVFAAAAGTTAGVSWVKSSWLYSEKFLSRSEAFRKGLNECRSLYDFTIVLLIAAATAETAAILLI